MREALSGKLHGIMDLPHAADIFCYARRRRCIRIFW
jgi:hypothetical protein